MSEPAVSLPDRLWIASEQIRLTSTAISAMASSTGLDTALAPHVGRLEQRTTELLRSALRLSRRAGVAESWGLDILFGDAVATPPLRVRPTADDTIDLEPLALFEPVAPPQLRARPPSTPPWTTKDTPTLDRGSEGDDHAVDPLYAVVGRGPAVTAQGCGTSTRIRATRPAERPVAARRMTAP